MRTVFLESPYPEVRKQAYEAYLRVFKGEERIFAKAYRGEVELSNEITKKRQYPSALETYLDREGVPRSFVDQLITTANNELEPLHKYLALRKEILGLSELHPYDLTAPLVSAGNRRYTYDEAREIILAALEPMGSEYIAKAAHALDPNNGWVDIFPNQRKRSGGFAANEQRTHPFGSINFLGSADDVCTLAHEIAGHVLHAVSAEENQSAMTYKYAMVIAETASTFNEHLVLDYLIRNAKNPLEKLSLLDERAKFLSGTFYKQLLYTEFEIAAHEALQNGINLTAQYLNATYLNLLKKYYGSAVSLTDLDGVSWMPVPHFYMNFYVWSYAGSVTASTEIAHQLKTEGTRARDRYLELISLGNSRPPLEIFKVGGVDFSKEEAFLAVPRLLEKTTREMETIAREQGLIH